MGVQLSILKVLLFTKPGKKERKMMIGFRIRPSGFGKRPFERNTTALEIQVMVKPLI